MYLTRFEINPARRGARKLLGSPQAMHAAVLAGFPGTRSGDTGRVLWRVDSGPQHVWLYVVGPDEPDLTHLVEQAGWPTTEAWLTKSYDRLLASLAGGQRWGFRLTANPTRATRLGDAARSKRIGHVTADHQRRWFLERAKSWGIELPDVGGEQAVVIRDRMTTTFRRQKTPVTLVRATFDGELVVVDPERLRFVLVNGIGPAKAYGCGLMTLAPVRPGP